MYNSTFLRKSLSMFLIVIVCLVFFGLTVKGIKGNIQPDQVRDNLDQITQPLELAPERSRFIHTLSLREFGTYALNPALASTISQDLVTKDNQGFNYFAPGVSYLALPFYVLGESVNLSQIFTFGLVSLLTLFAGLFTFKICKEVFNQPNSIAIFSSLVFLFATTSWSYATTLYDHNITALLVLISFYSIWRYKQSTGFSGLIWSAVIWGCYGAAIFVDYMNLFTFLPLIVYFIVVSFSAIKTNGGVKVGLRWSMVFGILIFLSVSVLHGYHNYKYFGGWNKTSLSLVGTNVIDINSGGSGPTGQITLSEGNLPLNFFTLTVSLDRGIFIYSPILLFGLLGLIRTKRNLEYVILLAFIILNFFIFSSSSDPWGGWAYGPRYLIPTMAILSIFVGQWLSVVKYKLTNKIVVALFFVYSSAVALLGVLTTNGVPPKVESLYLGIKYTYFRNLDLLLNNESSSFAYNNYLAPHLTLTTFFVVTLSVLVIISFMVLFSKEKYDGNND